VTRGRGAMLVIETAASGDGRAFGRGVSARRAFETGLIRLCGTCFPSPRGAESRARRHRSQGLVGPLGHTSKSECVVDSLRESPLRSAAVGTELTCRLPLWVNR